jgi:DUF2924 family protein
MSYIERRLAKLPSMKSTAVHLLWQKTFGSAVPTGAKRDFLVRILAYALQEKLEGPLPRSIAKQLAAYPTEPKVATRKAPPQVYPPALRLGARLVRVWKGKTHEVTVIDRGYAYRGKKYRSLSIIAELITGVHWSGPRFFGLRSRNLVRSESTAGEAT